MSSFVSVLTTIGPPLTIVTALMIYFGWARSAKQSAVMGLDVSLFGFSTQDYVMRSISTLFVPLLVLAALALGLLSIHRRLETAMGKAAARRGLGTVGSAATALGVAAVAAAVIVVAVDRSKGPLVIPLVIAAGTAVAAYGAWLSRTARDGDSKSSHPAWEGALRTLLVGVIISLALFWEVSSYAEVVGRGYAEEISEGVPNLPRATAISAVPLGIQAPGVEEERVPTGPGGGESVQYRTTGLRLLAKSGGYFFLLHDGWRPGAGPVVVIPDSDEVRWEFSR